MATYQILSWKSLPAQVRVEHGGDEVSLELDRRAQELIDAAAVKDGLTDPDAYLQQWHWSEPQERAGSAQEVAAALKRELEAQLGLC